MREKNNDRIPPDLHSLRGNTNDKNLGRANFLKPLPEFTKKEWLW